MIVLLTSPTSTGLRKTAAGLGVAVLQSDPSGESQRGHPVEFEFAGLPSGYDVYSLRTGKWSYVDGPWN